MSGMKPVIGGSGIVASSLGSFLLFDGSDQVGITTVAKIVAVALIAWAYVYWVVFTRILKRSHKS